MSCCAEATKISIADQEYLISENITSELLLSKSEIARYCNVTPQNINYVYNRMVADERIPDYYKDMVSKKRHEAQLAERIRIKNKQTNAQQKKFEKNQPVNTLDSDEITELGFHDPHIAEMIQDMEFNFHDAYGDYL